VAEWFTQHNYFFTTNEDGGDLGFSTHFFSPKVEHAAYHCLITTDRANEILTITASSPGALESIPGDLVPKILTIFNSQQNWGHYGIGYGAQTLHFKLSLFHSSGQLTSQELDRLLSEAFEALDSATTWLSPFKKHHDQDNKEQAPTERGLQTAILEL